MAMALGKEVLSVATDILKNVHRIDRASDLRSLEMAKKCPVGCTCGKHGGGAMLSPAEKAEKERQRMLGRNRTPARREYMRTWRAAKIAADPEGERERGRQHAKEWREANPERSRENWRAWNAANREKRRRYDTVRRRVRAHGLSPEDFARVWQEQRGECCYCALPLDTKNPRNVHVDHDHSCCPPGSSCTACRRGLACNNCNVIIGMASEDWDRLMAIAASGRKLAAEACERISGKPHQGELPLNVLLLHREEAG